MPNLTHAVALVTGGTLRVAAFDLPVSSFFAPHARKREQGYYETMPRPSDRLAMKPKCSLHERLYIQRALVGLLQLHPNLLLVEMAAECGYDFLFLDGEHGVFSEEDFCTTLQALAETNVLAMVRLVGHDPQALRRYLDMGADAIIVPHISTAEEAQSLIRAMPLKKEARLIVIIESVLGVSNAQAILGLEGVDGALVGPNDLTADLGRPGDYGQPVYAQALSRIERAAAAEGKFLGTVPHAGYPLEVLLARGHRLFILGTDRSLIGEAMSAQVAKAKFSVEGKIR